MFIRLYAVLFLLLISFPVFAQGDGLVSDTPQTLDEQMSNAVDGDVGSQYNLGMKYARGDGVPQDYKTAAKWLEMAANQGDADAQGALGVMYQKGQGVNEDINLAALWYKRAAAQGDKMSQFNLASIYATGRGSMRNEKEAFFWVSLAAVDNLQPPIIALRDLLQGKLSAAEVSEIQQRVSLWIPEQKAPEEMPEKLQYNDGQ
ncbi:MAG: Sel1 domain protein repeat-containing protein [Alphaproteobacteria bacterium]|jgi:hypothetical protein|nr:Sel1 domain protein repeat-containing protein [Alphaproteobacteria bacterium]